MLSAETLPKISRKTWNSVDIYDINCTLFAAVHRYIIDTTRFV